MTGHVVEPHPNTISGLEALAIGRVRAPRRARGREREETARPPLELLATHDALLDAEGRQAGERAFIVARREVVPRLHALDGVAVLIHVEDAEPHCERIERIDAHFPLGMECRCVERIPDWAETLVATEVVHPVHARLPTTDARRRSWNRASRCPPAFLRTNRWFRPAAWAAPCSAYPRWCPTRGSRS